MNSKLSYGYLNLRLARNALEVISKTKPSANLILDYLDRKKYMINALDNITTVEEGNNVRKVILNLSDESLKLMQTLQPELREYEDKFTAGNLEEMICLYILLNVDLLLSDKLKGFLDPVYKMLNVIINVFDIPFKRKLPVALRTVKIINDLSLQVDLNKIQKFMSMLKVMYSYKNIVYSVYYGIYDGTPMQSIYEFTDSDKVDISLLNSDDILPDSIIKEFVINDQLVGVTPENIAVTIYDFFTPIKNRKGINSKYIAQKLFENDLNDLNSEAKLLDIRFLINNIKLVTDDNKRCIEMIKNGEYILPPYQKGGLKNGNI